MLAFRLFRASNPWIAVPAVVMSLADALATYLAQPASCWAGDLGSRRETSPLGRCSWRRTLWRSRAL